MFHGMGPWSRILVCALALAVVGPLATTMDGQEKRDLVDRPDASRKPDAAQKQEPAKKPDSEPKPNPVPKPDFARYQARGNGSTPLIHDWSTRHVIYTGGYTGEQAERMAKDPRAYAAFLAHGMEHRRHEPNEHHSDVKPGTLKRDWNVFLGSGFMQTSIGMFPAKYTFDVNAPPSCANDFVVFPISASPGTGSVRANVAGTFTADPIIGQTTSITITPTGLSPVTLTLTAGTTNAGTMFAVSGTNSTFTDTTNLAAAINRNLSSVGLDEVAAIAPSGPVMVYALTAGTGVTLSVANSLSNFSWGSVTAGRNGSQANIVGLNNLYAGSGSPFCAGYTYPTFTFSYSAGASGVATSPTLSLDGRKIAFVESDDEQGLGAILHVLTLGSGTEYGSCTNSGTAPPTCATAAIIPGSAGSQATDYMLPLGALASDFQPTNDGGSSPFVDYSADVLYVGDSFSNLFSVSPVFGSGTPAIRSGFPVRVGAGGLSSPVVDVGNTGNIFVENPPRLYNVTSSGVVEGYIGLGYDDVIPGDGPDVDSTNGVGYAIADCDNSLSMTGALTQFSTPATGNPGILATVNLAPGCGGQPVFNATEDNNYFAKGISSGTAGNNGDLLVAYTGSAGGSLAQIQFTSGIMNTRPEYVNTDNGALTNGFIFTPLTEFYGDDQAYAIGTVTQSGNTVTVTTAANLFVPNQLVVISGVQAGTLGSCTSAAANAMVGEQTITVTSPTTFTFTSAVNTTIGGSSGSCNLTGALATGPTQDYLFFASSPVSLSSLPEVFVFDLPLTSATQTAAAYNTSSVGRLTNGIVVDNDSSDGQASSLYYLTSCGTNSACAVKLTQAGLN
jgi:hypothetical protein